MQPATKPQGPSHAQQGEQLRKLMQRDRATQDRMIVNIARELYKRAMHYPTYPVLKEIGVDPVVWVYITDAKLKQALSLVGMAGDFELLDRARKTDPDKYANLMVSEPQVQQIQQQIVIQKKAAAPTRAQSPSQGGFDLAKLDFGKVATDIERFGREAEAFFKKLF